jgi:hypothetical protein
MQIKLLLVPLLLLILLMTSCSDGSDSKAASNPADPTGPADLPVNKVMVIKLVNSLNE